MPRHLIIGNGVAGITAAQSIVRADASAEVHVYGAEPYPYYQRPRLWQYLAGEVEQDDLYFRPLEWYASRGIQVHLDTRVTAVDPAEHRVQFADGSRQTYDRLLLATGGRSFVPPFEGVDRQGVFALRSLDDALAIKRYAGQVSSVAVIGYIPPDRPLPVTMMSGSMPCLVMPHISPVRISPVCTSSAM